MHEHDSYGRGQTPLLHSPHAVLDPSLNSPPSLPKQKYPLGPKEVIATLVMNVKINNSKVTLGYVVFKTGFTVSLLGSTQYIIL